MSVVVEEEQAEDVGSEAEAADDEDKLGIANFLRLDKTLDSFKEDGQAEGDEEDTVDQCTKSLGSLETVGKEARVVRRIGSPHSPQTDAEGKDIVQHVERVGHERERMDGIADDQLQQEEGAIDAQEDEDAGGLGETHAGRRHACAAR